MKSSFTKNDSRGMIIALMATAAIHLSLAAGVIWGGWLETGTTGFPQSPREVLVMIDLSEPANTFVPVDPKTATPKPPDQQTPLYSNANSQAANPKPADASKPSLDGQNEQFPGTFNNPQPALKPIPQAARTQPDSAPQPLSHVDLQPQKSARPVAVKPGPMSPRRNDPAELENLIEPSDVLGQPIAPTVTITLPAKPHPPTLAEARQRLQEGVSASRKRKQNGGVSRAGPPALNVRLTGYSDYDARFINAVRHAWLRYRAKLDWFHPGHVVIDFKLHHTGAITDLAVRNSTARPRQTYYCRQALEGPAPFPEWTPTMRREIGADFRRCQFSFHYLVR